MEMYEFYEEFFTTFDSEFQQMIPVILGVLGVIALVALIFAVLSYVLTACGYHTVAKRRGIKNPWLAWVPVANVWLIGCISDQYQYVVKGKVTNRRKIMLGLQIASVAVSFIMNMISSIVTLSASGSENAWAAAAAVSSVSSLLTWGVAIAAMVFNYIALYDYYSSCCPKNNVLFLVLGIFFSFLTPFFVFFSRKKDGGMPPRRNAQPVASQPAAAQEIPQIRPVTAPADVHADEFVDIPLPVAPDITEPWEKPREADPWNADNQE